ncbi:TonB-linked outer membrane protein, SusC/RagA family [Fodinibius roseus]|uniref:TonB-linked outer membrane protein, SusC/RagA family n=1 Tax=Fodinibius roseus TaxID=1194090 RepID=A0A1M5KTK5_9BACT|nr:TonB-dependent receptor [Fodinibius roseus]SHG56192.1 TonB-linked outer membrane protein, SusC/RagA family [Fodinibius roseus]
MEKNIRWITVGLGVMFLTLFALTPNLYAQQQNVSGTVTDAATGETLPGVNVVVKGTTAGTATNAGGEFNLTVESLQDTLVVSFVGYETKEVAINGRNNLEIELQSAAIFGEELVVIGYGTQERRDLTGSVASVNSNDFEAGFHTNPDQILQGKTSGIQINQATGAPGAQSRVRIRGTGSINAGNSPLYVIDGMPITNRTQPTSSTQTSSQPSNNPLASLSPGDIESIEILKDASATAIYGARGANGVIMITTKHGEEGFKINYNGTAGVQNVANRMDVLSAEEYVSVKNGLAEIDGEPPVFSQSDIEQIGPGVNWQDEIYRTAAIQNHQISFSRGLETTNYYLSFNMFNQEGLVINSNMERYAGRFNIDHSTENLKFGLNLSTLLVENDQAPQGKSANEGVGVIGSSVDMDPTMPIFDSDGEFMRHSVITADNPLAISNGVSILDRTYRTYGNAFLEYEIMNNLTTRVNFGSDRNDHRSDAFSSSLTLMGEGAGGMADVVTRESTDYLAEFTTNYSIVLGKVHDMSAMAGITYQSFNSKRLSGEATGFPSEVTRTDNLGLGSRESYGLGTNAVENRLLSYLGRVNYTLSDRYLLTATFRADGSSRFGPENRFGYFPSFALGWRLSDEPFMDNMKYISELKVRGSWGITGNQEIGNFNYLQTLSGGGSAAFGGNAYTTVRPERIPNQNLQWEETTQTNIGVDYSLLDNRLSGSVDWYSKDTDNLLLNLPVPSTSGFSSILSNVGSVRNTGWEFQLETRNVVNSNFNWSTSANLTLLNNEVIDLGPIPEIIHGFGGNVISQFALIRPGFPLNSYYGWEIEGVFQEGDDIASSAQPDAEPGYWKFKDLNNDGAITSEDKSVIGSPHPDVTFGVTNNFNYRRFSLRVFLRGVIGNEKLNSNLIRTYHPIDRRRNALREPLLNRWTPENPSNKYPSGANLGVYAGGGTIVHNEVVEDASFMRLQNVTLGYDLPSVLGNIFQTARVYITGQNLVTITNYSGFDPEVSSFGDSDVLVDYNTYPFARTFQLGIDITF